MKHDTHIVLKLCCATLLVAATSACAPIATTQTAVEPGYDPVAAKKMAQQDSCLRCHGQTKQKEGPTYSAVAKKYYGNPDAEARLYQHLTTGEVAKMSDGHTEMHKNIANQKPEDIRNLVQWILRQ
jgi:cytochrome c